MQPKNTLGPGNAPTTSPVKLECLNASELTPYAFAYAMVDALTSMVAIRRIYILGDESMNVY